MPPSLPPAFLTRARSHPTLAQREATPPDAIPLVSAHAAYAAAKSRMLRVVRRGPFFMAGPG